MGKDFNQSPNIFSCKHINEISSEDQSRAIKLQQELQELLEKYALLPPEQVHQQMKEASKLRVEIERIGFLVETNYRVTSALGEPRLGVEITLRTLKLKPGMIN